LALTSGHNDFKGGRLLYFSSFATLNPEKNHDRHGLVLPTKRKTRAGRSKTKPHLTEEKQ